MPTDPVPSGESPLEERLLEYVSAFDGARDAYTGEPEVFHRDMIAEAAAELARLRAEVARLSAERDEWESTATHFLVRTDTAEAEAARYREALEREESVRGAMDDFEGNRADLDAMFQARAWYPEYGSDYRREVNDLYRDLGSNVAAIYHYRAPAFDRPAAPTTEGGDSA